MSTISSATSSKKDRDISKSSSRKRSRHSKKDYRSKHSELKKSGDTSDSDASTSDYYDWKNRDSPLTSRTNDDSDSSLDYKSHNYGSKRSKKHSSKHNDRSSSKLDRLSSKRDKHRSSEKRRRDRDQVKSIGQSTSSESTSAHRLVFVKQVAKLSFLVRWISDSGREDPVSVFYVFPEDRTI